MFLISFAHLTANGIYSPCTHCLLNFTVRSRFSNSDRLSHTTWLAWASRSPVSSVGSDSLWRLCTWPVLVLVVPEWFHFHLIPLLREQPTERVHLNSALRTVPAWEGLSYSESLSFLYNCRSETASRFPDLATLPFFLSCFKNPRNCDWVVIFFTFLQILIYFNLC